MGLFSLTESTESTEFPYGKNKFMLTQRAQRTRSFNSPAVHADAGEVASFTTTGERRARMANEYTIQPLISANLCALPSRVASDPSSDSVI